MRLKVLGVLVLALAACFLLVALSVTPARALTGSVVSYPFAGPPGTLLTLNATGFTPNSTYTVYFNNVATAYTGSTTATGDFTVSQFLIPAYPRGYYPIRILTNAGDGTAITPYFTITPAVALSANSGYEGDQVTVNGSGFVASNSVNIYFDGAQQAATMSTASGTITTTFTAPQTYGGLHQVAGNDGSGVSPSVSFSILPRIAVTPTVAAVGEKVIVSGSGFGGSQPVTVALDGAAVATFNSDAKGTLASGTFPLPASASGSHTLTATDVSGNSASAILNTKVQATISPVTGPGGTRVTVNGTGFNPSATVTITFDNVKIDAAATSTSATGAFSTTFDVPASSGGAHSVAASDGSNVDTRSFTVMTLATIKPTSGYAGTQINISGSGFLTSAVVNIVFDNVSVKKVTSGPDGSLSASFDAPAKVAGTYTVRVTDGTNSKDLGFAITTGASIDPVTSSSSEGYVGQKVTVSGIGFLAGKTITVSYDGNQVATGPIDSDSRFSVTFAAPASKGGPHTVTVSDGLNSLPVAFFMDTSAPLPPTLMKPEAAVQTPAAAAFIWTGVSDPSGITYTLQIADNPQFSNVVFEKAGIDKTEYQLNMDQQLKPSKKNKPYYWQVKAVDGASNESRWSDARSFTVGSPFPTWATYTLIALGAAIIVLFVLWTLRRSASRLAPTKSSGQSQP